MRDRKRTFWSVGVIGLVLAATSLVASAEPVEVGQAVPGFALATLSGGELELAARVAEGPVVLVFFRGAW